MQRRQITIGQKRLGYLTAESPGPGTPRQPLRNLVLLHAFPLNAAMWQPQLDAVPAGWRVIAPDYRGFGDSFPPSPAATMNDLAGDVVDLLDHLEIQETIVAGCSMGGYVAFELLASAPNYVKGLVLIDTRAGADTEEGKAGRRKMLEKVQREGAGAIADEMTPKLLGASTQRDRPDLVKQVHAMISSADPNAIAMAVNAMMGRKDMTASLGNITIPTLIIAGAEDTLMPLAAMQQMHGAIRGAQFQTIDAAGHLPSLERRAGFDLVLQQFLKQF
jgi:pimeloyl-ACP methyl ester carboxylesterase